MQPQTPPDKFKRGHLNCCRLPVPNLLADAEAFGLQS